MNHSVYPITRVGRLLRFLFWSSNPAGTSHVLKLVTYSKVIKHGRVYYNLDFGDYNQEKDLLYDTVVTNNGDMRKVLRTVISTLETFFGEYPDEDVHIDGSDRIRREYYHKIVRDYYGLISQYYKVLGCINRKLEPFQPRVVYEFIVVRARKV